MEGWKSTQRKLCIFKKIMGFQNLGHFKGNEKMHGQIAAWPFKVAMNVSPIGEVIELVKSIQAMLLKHNEAHMALIQVLGKHRGVLISESKSFNQAYEGPLPHCTFTVILKKKVQCVHQWLVQVEAFMETRG
jgi:hypothetical protein